MDKQFDNMSDEEMKGYMLGNVVQINQNLISSAKAHLFLTNLTNKGTDNATAKQNNTK